MTNPFAPQVPAQEAPQQAPQQQAPAGNPFAQQAPPAAPPTGNPYAQQQYAPPAAPQQYANPYAQQAAPQQYAAPAAAAPQAYSTPAAPPALGQLAAAPPPVVSDGKGAKLADMYGRLVVMFPLKTERVPRNPQYITTEQRAAGNVEQDRMTVTVVVLDDGQGGMQPIAFGGAPYAIPPTPHTDSSPLPYVRRGMWINQSRLISQLSSSLPAGPGQGPGVVCGRVVKAGPSHNDPWYLQGANEQDLALAQRYLSGVANGEFPHPLA